MDDSLRETHGSGGSLKEPSPSQIIRQKSGGNATKSFHPSVETAVVGVDILDVEDAFDHPFPVGGMTVRWSIPVSLAMMKYWGRPS